MYQRTIKSDRKIDDKLSIHITNTSEKEFQDGRYEGGGKGSELVSAGKFGRGRGE